MQATSGKASCSLLSPSSRATPIAAAGTILAVLSGAGFVESGVAASSLVMSIGFLLALIAYAVGLYVTYPKSRSS